MDCTICCCAIETCQQISRGGNSFDKPLMNKRPDNISARQKLLNSPAHILPVPSESIGKLEKMGFRTVREAFRAALAGRLCSRKLGGADFEDSILEAGCTILGHPVFNRSALKSFTPLDSENCFADVLERFSGHHIDLKHGFMSRSVREILLPSTMHNAIRECGLRSLHDLLSFPLSKLSVLDSVSEITLGSFLAHIFDYIFILNDQTFDSESTGNDILRKDEPSINESIPGQPSLNSWPGENIVAEGREILKKGQLQSFFFFRNTAGAIFNCPDEVETSVYLTLTPTARNENFRFEISDASCEICSLLSYQTTKCIHIAALAQYLINPNNHFKSAREPVPSFFLKSPWYVIGQILFDMFGEGKDCGAAICSNDKCWQLSIPGPDRLPYARWRLDGECAALTSALYGNTFEWQDEPTADISRDSVITLRSKIFEMGRSQAEIELNLLNKRTLNQERDESVWMWLAGQMCIRTHPEDISLEGPGPGGLFTFKAFDRKQGHECLTMTIPRAKMPDLLDGFSYYGRKDLLLPPANAITKVSMDSDGSMIVSPQLVLADGRALDRGDLEEQLYGRYYYLPDEGFLSIQEQEPGNAIAGKGNSPRKIGSNHVPETLEKHQNALKAIENDIDPSLSELTIQETPDILEIDSFDSDADWCYLSGKYGIGSRHISLNELLAARNEKRDYLPGERKWLRLNNSPLSWFHDLGDERRWTNEQTGETGVRLTRREMLMLSAIIPTLQMKESARGKNLLNQLLETDRWIENDKLEGMPEHLRDYQKHGIAWLNQIYHNRLAGILADDMGLGKTHQALGLLEILVTRDNSNHKYLVVCPATVVPHWAEKIDKFFPKLNYYIYHGSRRDLEKAGDCDIFITTYGIVRRDSKTLAAFNFEIIIFDEIQQVKNKKTDVHKAAGQLKGKVALGLTGTPLENSVTDLKAIFDICLPGYLGNDLDFRARYGDPIEEDNDPGAKENLARIINPFLLRRTREQVLPELPDVIEDLRTCKLSEDQVSLYRDLISGRGREILNKISGEENGKILPYMELLAVINYLKQICDHPCLIKKCTDPNLFRSGKWDLFLELLNECLSSEMKVVVFSHYTKMLDLIENHLEQTGITFCRLRGDMPIGLRHEMIQRFNNDDSCKVFSASLLAGGVGVDLTAAQAVIHYDRWWNAAREDQATARVHRMGQKHVVQVFKLITEGTLEEKIHTLISKKRELAKHMVREDDSAIIKRLSREELINLLTAVPA